MPACHRGWCARSCAGSPVSALRMMPLPLVPALGRSEVGCSQPTRPLWPVLRCLMEPHATGVVLGVRLCMYGVCVCVYACMHTCSLRISILPAAPHSSLHRYKLLRKLGSGHRMSAVLEGSGEGRFTTAWLGLDMTATPPCEVVLKVCIGCCCCYCCHCRHCCQCCSCEQ